MKKAPKLILLSTVLTLINLFLPARISAQTNQDCYITPNAVRKQQDSAEFTITYAYPKNFNQMATVNFWCPYGGLLGLNGAFKTIPLSDITDLKSYNSIRFTVQNKNGLAECWNGLIRINSLPSVFIYDKNHKKLCETNKINIVNEVENEGKLCEMSISPDPPDPGQPFQVTLSNLPSDLTDGTLRRSVTHVAYYQYKEIGPAANTNYDDIPGYGVDEKVWLIVTGEYKGNQYNRNHPMCAYSFIVGKKRLTPDIPPPDPVSSASASRALSICEYARGNETECRDCMLEGKIFTALGCIPTKPQDLVMALLRIAISLAGGIAFLMIIISGFNIMTSGGNPEKLNSAKEIITSAISGLLLILFSVVILRIIGVDIFNIPGIVPDS